VRKLTDLKPEPLTTTDKKEVRKDIHYAGFRKGLIITSVISGIGLILFVLTHLYSWGFLVELRDIAVIFSAGIVAVTCFYHAKNLRLNIEANEKKILFDFNKFEFEQEQKNEDAISKKLFEQRKFAYELCREVVTPQMTIHLQRARQFYKNDLLIAELKKISPNDDTALKEWSHKFDSHPARKSVILVLNYFEQIAIAIEEGFANAEVAKKSLKTIMQQYFVAYRSYIDYRQKDKDYGSATFLLYFEKLVISWSDGSLK
jgi:hypothetical protein